MDERTRLKVKDHLINDKNPLPVRVTARDERNRPPHYYELERLDGPDGAATVYSTSIQFQDGPRNEEDGRTWRAA